MSPLAFERPRSRSRRARAFTLMESLVVVAIVGALAAFTIPTLSSLSGSGQRVAITNQMRQLHVAVMQFANDNDGRLPGPLWSGQGFRYKKNKTEALLTHIGPYLNSPTATGNWAVDDTLMTRPQKKWFQAYDGNDGEGSFYSITVDGSVIPFGYADKAIQPMKLPALTNLANTVMFRELDQKASWANPSSGYFKKCPPQPLHGDMRYISYFDGSVRGFTRVESDR